MRCNPCCRYVLSFGPENGMIRAVAAEQDALEPSSFSANPTSIGTSTRIETIANLDKPAKLHCCRGRLAILLVSLSDLVSFYFFYCNDRQHVVSSTHHAASGQPPPGSGLPCREHTAVTLKRSIATPRLTDSIVINYSVETICIFRPLDGCHSCTRHDCCHHCVTGGL